MEKKKILIVDDSDVILAASKKYLQAKGYEVQICKNWGLLTSMIGNFAPHLILMDVEMEGGLGGGQLLPIIKKRYPGLKMVYHSSIPLDELIQLTKNTNADGYMPKTSDPDDFVKKVASFL